MEANNTGKEMDIIVVWRSLWEWRYRLLSAFFVPAVITMGVSLLWPKTYTAKVTVISPGFNQMPVGSVPLAFRLTNQATVLSRLLVSIVKSDRMLDEIIKEFDLVKVFKKKDEYSTRIYLYNLIKVRYSEESSVITISVSTRSPTLSADIANFIVENLDNINEELGLTSLRPMVKVIDKARPPKKKSSPRIKFNMAVAGISGFLLALFALYIKSVYGFFLEKRSQ